MTAPTHVAGPPRLRRPWKFNWTATLIVLMGLIGVGVLMYPSTAAWWSQYHQSQLIGSYNQSVLQEPYPHNEDKLAEAHAYNQALTSGALTVGEHKPTTDGSANPTFDYWHLLSEPDVPLGRILFPAAEVDLPIYHGTNDDVLLKGVGHLEGTALPVGGADTHSVLAAHRGLASATMFDHLDQVQVGDTFTVQVLGEVLTYRVVSTQVVKPEDTKTIAPQPGRDLITLVTCTPLGINTHRVLVTGERVMPTPAEEVDRALSNSDLPGFPWWAVILGTAVIGGGLLIWRSGYPPKSKPSRETQS